MVSVVVQDFIVVITMFSVGFCTAPVVKVLTVRKGTCKRGVRRRDSVVCCVVNKATQHVDSERDLNYQSPLSTRYASKGMRETFSDLYRFRLWRELWLVLADSERELGLEISKEQVWLKRHCLGVERCALLAWGRRYVFFDGKRKERLSADDVFGICRGLVPGGVAALEVRLFVSR